MISNEQVLGVPRSKLGELLSSNKGFLKNKSWYEVINRNLTSKLRSDAEDDDSFKQIIRYLIIKNGYNYLTYSRSKKQSEARLHNKISIGIGGHLNPIDTSQSDIIIKALKRELNEEISILLDSSPSFQGFINDDTTEVGRVHLGLVFLATSRSEEFFVNESDKMNCYWSSPEDLRSNYDYLESWSQIILDNISSFEK